MATSVPVPGVAAGDQRHDGCQEDQRDDAHGALPDPPSGSSAGRRRSRAAMTGSASSGARGSGRSPVDAADRRTGDRSTRPRSVRRTWRRWRARPRPRGARAVRWSRSIALGTSWIWVARRGRSLLRWDDRWYLRRGTQKSPRRRSAVLIVWPPCNGPTTIDRRRRPRTDQRPRPVDHRPAPAGRPTTVHPDRRRPRRLRVDRPAAHRATDRAGRAPGGRCHRPAPPGLRPDGHGGRPLRERAPPGCRR